MEDFDKRGLKNSMLKSVQIYISVHTISSFWCLTLESEIEHFQQLSCIHLNLVMETYFDIRVTFLPCQQKPATKLRLPAVN